MICVEEVERRLQEAALKERMLLDSFIILGTIEVIQEKLEKKLLEWDEVYLYNKDGDLSSLRSQILALIAKLKQEEKRMDEFMVKYRKLVYEKKALLPRARTKKPIYLRGVSPHERRVA
jgi:hypothetical protein